MQAMTTPPLEVFAYYFRVSQPQQPYHAIAFQVFPCLPEREETIGN